MAGSNEEEVMGTQQELLDMQRTFCGQQEER